MNDNEWQGQLLFGTARFLTEQMFKIEISSEELLFEAGTFAQHQLFSAKLHFGKGNYLEK